MLRILLVAGAVSLIGGAALAQVSSGSSSPGVLGQSYGPKSSRTAAPPPKTRPRPGADSTTPAGESTTTPAARAPSNTAPASTSGPTGSGADRGKGQPGGPGSPPPTLPPAPGDASSSVPNTQAPPSA